MVVDAGCHVGPIFIFFFNDTATTEIYTLSLHDALPISLPAFPCSFLFSFHLSLHPVSLRLPAQFASSISLLVSSLLLILISLYLFSPSASGLPSPLLLHSLFLLSSFISFLPLPFSLSFLSSPLFLFQHLIHPPFSSSLLPNLDRKSVV